MVEACGITISPDLLAACLSHIGVDPAAMEFVSEDQFMRLVQDIMFGEASGATYYEGDDKLLDLVYECELGGNEDICPLADSAVDSTTATGANEKAFPLVKIQALLRRFRLEDTIFQQLATKQKPVRSLSLSDSQLVEKEKKKPPPPPFVPLVSLEKLKKCLHGGSGHDGGVADDLKKGSSINATAALAQLLAEHRDNTCHGKVSLQQHLMTFGGVGVPQVVVEESQPRGRTPEKMSGAMTRIRMASTVTQSLQHLLDYSKNPNAAANLISTSSGHLSTSRSNLTGHSSRQSHHHAMRDDDLISVDQRTRPDTASSASDSTSGEMNASSTTRSPCKTAEKVVLSTPKDPQLLLPDPSEIVLGLSRKLLEEFTFEDSESSVKFHREATLPFQPLSAPSQQLTAMKSFSRNTVTTSEIEGTSTQNRAVPTLCIREKKSYSKPWNEKPVVFEHKQLSKAEQDRKATMRMSVEELSAAMDQTEKSVLRALSPKLKLQLQQSPLAAVGRQSSSNNNRSTPQRLSTASPSPSSGISRPSRLAPLTSPSKTVENDIDADRLMARWLMTSVH